jgi:single-strand DNA-binding protein
MPNGMKVTSFGVATNRTWKDANGAKQEAVEYHNIISFGKQAEVIAQYCKKGDSIFVEGRLQTRKWEDKDGKTNYKTEIVVENFQFGTKANPQNAPQSATSPVESTSAQERINATSGVKLTTKDATAIEYPESDIDLSLIPF